MSKVVFFGSPDFALPALEILIDTGYRPVLVVSQPDRPAGRGRKTIPTPVRKAAEENDIDVRVISAFDEETEEHLRSLEPDFFVVVAFGLIFPERILDIPSKECINVHASLLPAYRGASPVNMALVNGDPFTGVSTMRMVKALDAGPVFMQSVQPVDPLEDAGSLSAKLAWMGARLLLDTLAAIDGEGLVPVEQSLEGVSKAPLLRKEDGNIPWAEDALTVHNYIRGMNPWPGSHTYYGGGYIKVHRAEPLDLIQRGAEPGTVIRAEGSDLVVACGTGAVSLVELQAQGKRRMTAGEFMRGYQLEKGGLFSGADR